MYHFFLHDMQVNACIGRRHMVYFVATTYFDNDKGRDYLEYIEKVVPVVEKYNGRYIIRSEKITPLCTNWKPNRVIIIEFDTKQNLEECFASEEYRKIAALRENSVDSKAIIVE